MKRATFVSVILLILLSVWGITYPFCDNKLYWLGIPVGVVGLFGIYSLGSILKSVYTLKDYPSE